MIRIARPLGAMYLATAIIVALSGRRPLAQPPGAGDRPSSFDGAEAYYTAAQAERGAALWKQQCDKCHPGDALLGSKVTEYARQTLDKLPGGAGKREWATTVAFPNVYYLYTRLKDQPAPDTKAITPRQRQDIVAYFLHQAGFPAGATELSPDEEAMKLMPLDEPGFVRLFDGKDLSASRFTFVPGEIIGGNQRTTFASERERGVAVQCIKPQGCVTPQPAPNWVVRNGVLVCVGNEHGYFYTEKKYLNFKLRLDYRFPRPTGWEGPDELFGGNAGYYIFLDPVAATGAQVEGMNKDVLSVYFIHQQQPKKEQDNSARTRALHPLGEWNSVEIVSKNGDLKTFLNGELITHIPDHGVKQPGFIGFQFQGHEFHMRNIRAKEE
jgi:hypothetical protein